MASKFTAEEKQLNDSKKKQSEAEDALREAKRDLAEANDEVLQAKSELRGDESSYDSQPLTFVPQEDFGTRYRVENEEDVVAHLGNNTVPEDEDNDDSDPVEGGSNPGESTDEFKL